VVFTYIWFSFCDFIVLARHIVLFVVLVWCYFNFLSCCNIRLVQINKLFLIECKLNQLLWSLQHCNMETWACKHLNFIIIVGFVTLVGIFSFHAIYLGGREFLCKFILFYFSNFEFLLYYPCILSIWMNVVILVKKSCRVWCILNKKNTRAKWCCTMHKYLFFFVEENA